MALTEPDPSLLPDAYDDAYAADDDDEPANELTTVDSVPSAGSISWCVSV